MPVTEIDTKIDYEARDDEIAVRLCRVRESLNLTQTQFASQLSITRERLATYEDGRTPLKADVALRICRHFFVSEYWLARGSVDNSISGGGPKVEFSDLRARMTMSFATEPLAASLPPGIAYSLCFEKYLLTYYLSHAAKHEKFPRVTMLENDPPEYLANAISCMILFWRAGLNHQQWKTIFEGIISFGNNCRDGFLESNEDVKRLAKGKRS